MFCFKKETMIQIILSRLTMVEVLFLKVRLVVWLLWCRNVRHGEREKRDI